MTKKNKLENDSLECKEKATGDDNKAEGEREDAALPRHDDPSVAEEAVPAGEHFPLPPRPPPPLAAVDLRGRGRQRQRPRVDLLVLAVLHRCKTTSTRFVR